MQTVTADATTSRNKQKSGQLNKFFMKIPGKQKVKKNALVTIEESQGKIHSTGKYSGEGASSGHAQKHFGREGKYGTRK